MSILLAVALSFMATHVAGAYFQGVTVCPPSSSPVLASRSHARHARIPRNLPSPGRKTLKQGHQIVSGSSPQESSTDAIESLLPPGITPRSVQLDPTIVLQFDPGATHLFTPKPLDTHAPVTSYRDTLMVADGSSVPIVGKSKLGPLETFIAPSLTHALVPQSAIEKLGLISVMSAGQLRLYDVNYNQQTTNLFALLDHTEPVCSIPFEDNQYILPTAEFQRLLVTNKTISTRQLSCAHSELLRLNSARRSQLKIKHYHRTPTRRGLYLSRHARRRQRSASSVYFTTDVRSLRDLVLYWHIALGHKGEEDMVRIVQHRLVTNLPDQLTVATIRKYFRQMPKCKPCAEATLQRVPSPPSSTSSRPPPGEVWYLDFDKQSGSTDTSRAIRSISGYTHVCNAIDAGTDRLLSFPSRGTKEIMSYVRQTHEFNTQHGYLMTELHVDNEFARSHALVKWCSSNNVRLVRAIPYEHEDIGLIERANRTCSEGTQKRLNLTLRPHILPSYWCLAYADTVDMFNLSSHPSHPHSSPYQLYDHQTPDALSTPFLPWGTLVTGHIPLSLQSTQSGRGREYIYVGRCQDARGGIILLNPETNRTVIRRTFKVMGDHPVSNALFTQPLELFLGDDLADPLMPSLLDGADDDDDPLMPSLLDGADDDDDNNIVDDSYVDIPVVHPQYHEVDVTEVHHSQRRYFDRIGSTFTELCDDGYPVANWKIHTIVRADDDNTLHYRYYPSDAPPPSIDSLFENSLCSTLSNQIWSTWDSPTPAAYSAYSTSLPLREKLPKSYRQMLAHPRCKELLAAFEVEWASWVSRSVILPLQFDSSKLDKALIGDLMILWDEKYHSDGTFEKWKCRIVFRGDRWKNVFNIDTYASSLDSKALLLLLALAASLDLDLWALDIKTAFLYGKFPSGTHQYVRGPHGVPSKYFPDVFELGSCVYGHPTASRQFEIHNQGVLSQLGFTALRSTPSVYQIPPTSIQDHVIAGVITDDCIIMHPFDSPAKAVLLDGFSKHYEYTVKDPLINFNGITLTRDRALKRIGITQPQFLENMRFKYPLLPDQSHPRVPYPYNDYVTVQDKLDQTILLTSDSDKQRYHAMLGDLLWMQRFSKPQVAYAHQRLSRMSSPTLYNLNIGIQAIQYCAFTTQNDIRWVGGPAGAIIQTTVDSSFASEDNRKSLSSWTVHVGGGGAAICGAKTQTICADSTTSAEAIGNSMMLPDTIMAKQIFSELGYEQPTAIGVGNDNQSTIQICNNPANKGNTRHLDLRFSIVRDNIEREITRIFYLPTERMISDIGTKALSPAVFELLTSYLLGHVTLPDFMDYIDKHCPCLSFEPLMA